MANTEEAELPYNIGVHVTHCCSLHYCKYGDEDCPVQKGEYLQKYACEYCPDNVKDAESKIKDAEQRVVQARIERDHVAAIYARLSSEN